MTQAGTFTAQRISELDQIALDRWTPEIFHRFQCVWLSLVLNLPAQEIADALGLNVSTVRRIRMAFLRDGANAIVGKGNRGGRRNQHLTFDEEAAFLREHAELFSRSGMGDVKLLKQAFEAHIGKPIHKTTIYRLLERHGKRKVAAPVQRAAPAPKNPVQRKKTPGAIAGPSAQKAKGRKGR